jgi:predicted DNA-binding transcriptional regulator AlpA
MRRKGEKGSGSPRPGLRMKDLTRATGLPKSTILHYLHQGLLPDPVKTSPNMAYYDPDCIDRIKFIRHLQRHHRLSLSEIKRMMELSGDELDFSARLELKELVFGPSRHEGLIKRDAFCKETGLTADQVRSLLRTRLLLPIEKDRFDQEDVAIGKMFARGFSRGLRTEDLTYYVEFGEKIVDHEMALRQRMTRHLPYKEDASLTMEMVKNARMSRAYIVDRLFQHRVASMPDLKEKEDSGKIGSQGISKEGNPGGS